jgi:outer membrane protein
MMRKKNIIPILLAIIGVVIGSYSLWKTTALEKDVEKTAYVNLTVLFDGFEMKKELAISLKRDLSQKQNELDSLLFQLQAFNNKLSSVKRNDKQELLNFQQMQNYYVQQKKTLDEYQYSKTQQFDSQIIEQMTQYIKDFGNDNDYEYIYGLNSNGNIMYARDHKDISKEVLQFINGKYQGKK